MKFSPHWRVLSVGAALALPAMAGVSLAQAPAAPAPSPPPASPLGGQSKSPVDISSEGLEVIQPEHVYIYTGNVEVVQDDTRIRTPKMWIYTKDKTAPGAKPAGAPVAGQPDLGNVDHIDAQGPVYYVTSTQNARGDHGHYDGPTDTITLEGNVVLVQGKSVGKGDKLVIDRKTGVSNLIASNPKTPSGRIRTILYPNQQPAAGQPAPKKPS